MATNDKSFKVKNDLIVDGNQITLGTAPISFNTTNNKLQIYINEEWRDISDSSDISFMDLGLAIDYDGEPVYTVQANGVNPGPDSKFADGGSPSSTSFAVVFDSGAIA
jgi:hypothetical protein